MPVSVTTSYRRGASTSDACASECMCAADSRSAPPHNTGAPSVTSVAVSSVHAINSGAPTDDAALSATRVCVTRSNAWFDIAISADRSSDSEATLQWHSSALRFLRTYTHASVLCQLTGVDRRGVRRIQRERSMAPILCGTAHRSAIYSSCGAGVLAIQPPKAAVGGLRNVIAPKTFRRAQVLCPRSDPADSTAQ